MKIIHTKAVAIFGMLFSLLCAGSLVKGAVYTLANSDLGTEAWGAGIFAILASCFSMIAYGIDGVFCAIKAFKKIQLRLNAVLAVMIAVGFAFALVILLTPLRTAKIVVWYVFYFSIFVLEIVSLVRDFKDDTDII